MLRSCGHDIGAFTIFGHLHRTAMFQRNTLFLCIVVFQTLFSSCAILPRTDSARFTFVHGAGVVHHPVMADLDVRNTKVSGEATGPATSQAALRVQAVASAVKDSGADLLVEPIFDINPVSSSRIVVTVTGFPANYRNFRKATLDDLPFIEAGMQRPVQVAEAHTDSEPKKKGGAGIAILIVVLVGMVAALVSGGAM